MKVLTIKQPWATIITKVNMTDCVNVDEAIRNNLKHKNELVYRGIQDRNWHGYGFKLENVKNIKPIYVNGKLGFWNYEGDVQYE